MTPIQEKLNQFQKEMWSQEKPLIYAVEIVEKLLTENFALYKALQHALEQNREDFIEDIRAKLDFSQFENEEN